MKILISLSPHYIFGRKVQYTKNCQFDWIQKKKLSLILLDEALVPCWTTHLTYYKQGRQDSCPLVNARPVVLRVPGFDLPE